MKEYILLLIISITFSNCFTQNIENKIDTNEFYFENSKKKWDLQKMVWIKNNDIAIIRLNRYKGDCCGGVPDAKQITAKIVNDTVFYKLNLHRDTNCDSSIGLCGNSIDFVVNIKKKPTYEKFVFIEVNDK